MTEITEITRINQIAAPWQDIDTDRTAWLVTLTTGREITICAPLGAAVEIEEAGWIVRAMPTGDQLATWMQWQGIGTN